MTDRQIEKELERQKVLFEESCNGQTAGGNIKFEVFAKQWFKEYAEVKLRERTIARYRQLEARTYAALGHLRMDKITVRHVQKFIHNLGEEGINQTTGGRLAPKTIHHYLSFVSTIFSYAIEMQMVKNNPCEHVQLPKAEQKELDCYTLEEAQEFLNLLQKEPLKYQAFFTLAIYGGFRKGELLGLEWKDIDFSTGVISIRRSSLYTKGKATFTDTTKTKSSQRSLKIANEVLQVLKRYQSQQIFDRARLGDQWVDTDRLFTKWNGEPMHPNSPYTWLKRFCERTGQRFLGVHQFRHLNATLLINNRVDAKTVSASLGHTQVSTTLNIYAHTFQESQAKASEIISNALSLDLSQPKKNIKK